MAEKLLQTRIQLKYDTLENWSKTTEAGKGGNLVLKQGEVALCYVPSVTSGTTTTAPTVLFKVGDGSKAFSALPWGSGLAADVYDWAKASTKPTYSYNELTDKPTIPVDTNTQYKLVANGTNGFKVQSKDIGGDWADVSGQTVTLVQDATDQHKIGLQIGSTAVSTWITIPDNNDNQTIGAGTTTFGANDLVKIVGGSNVTVTPNATDKTITISSAFTNENQTVKGNGTAFGATAAVDFKPGDNVTITADTGANTITIASAHPTISTTASTGATAPDYAGTFAAVSSITKDSNGHITAINTNTVTMPSKQTLVSGSTSGTVSFDGTDVAVKGLGSAAYTESSAYATSAQGTKADNAMPVAGGDFSGAITVLAPTANMNPATKLYVDTEIAKIPKFDVVVCEANAAKIPAGAIYKDDTTTITGTMAASADTMYKIYMVKNTAAGAGAHVEYITIDNGSSASPRYSWEAIGTTVIDLSGYKRKQTAKADPATSGSGTEFIASIIQNENGEITATKKSLDLSTKADVSHTHGNITNGGEISTTGTIASGDGLVITDSSASNKLIKSSIAFDGSTTTKALTPKGTWEDFAKASDITTAIQALDVTGITGFGPAKTLATLTETDGKIAATFQDIAIAESQVTNLTTDLGGKVDKETGKGLSTNDFTNTYKDEVDNLHTTVQSAVTAEIVTLDSSVSATAASGNVYSVLTGVTQTDGKLTGKTEVTLSAVAKTGNVNDLIQTTGDVIVFSCGSSTTNV